MTHDGALWWTRPRMPAEDEPYARRWLALIGISMGIFIIALDATVVGIAAPSITTGLGATSSQIQWAFDAFTVTLAGFVILGAELAERQGRKGALIIGLLVFGAGSAVCAFAPSPAVLIAGRSLTAPGCRAGVSRSAVADQRPVSRAGAAPGHQHLRVHLRAGPHPRPVRRRLPGVPLLVRRGLPAGRARGAAGRDRGGRASAALAQARR